MKEPFLKRNLRDTPFSIERLFVWGVGIVMLIGAATMSALAIQQKSIPPQVQSLTMFCAGAFVARLEQVLKA